MYSQTTSSSFISIFNSINKEDIYLIPSANRENSYDSWIWNVKMKEKGILAMML